jgi:hypothetical protein
MPRPSQVVSLVIRLAVYAAAIAVVATARLPAPQPSSHPAIQRSAEPASRRAAEPPVIRLFLAGLLLTGIALDVRGRRAAWR